MKLYHGSTVPELKTLRANSRDREGNSVLYLTDNFAYSLFYIRDRDIDHVTCGVGKDDVVRYDEKLPGQLKKLYQGMAGYIYEVETEAEPTKINGIYVTRGDAMVTEATHIADAYESIQREINLGNVEIVYYEDLTEEQHAINHEGIVRLFLSAGNMHPKKEAFLRTHFSNAWDEAQKTNCTRTEA